MDDDLNIIIYSEVGRRKKKTWKKAGPPKANTLGTIWQKRKKKEVFNLTVKVRVDTVFQVGTRSKVDQLQVQCPHVNQKVFVFDVAMDDSLVVAGNHGLNDLAEKVPGQLLLQLSVFRDEVEQVLAGRWFLHDVDEGVVTFIKVDEFDDPRNNLHLGQQLELQRNSPSVEL